MRLDVRSKTKRVIAGALFSEFGVALLERFDDGEMFGQGGRSAIDPADGELTIAAHMQQDVVGHVDQHRAFAQRENSLMEGDIRFRIFLDMILRQAILAEWCETDVRLDDLVAHVTIHEIGHHFGLSDDDMHALEDAVADGAC